MIRFQVGNNRKEQVADYVKHKLSGNSISSCCS